MKLLNICTIIVSVVVVAQCHPEFVKFKETYGKSYIDETEENMRKNVFLKNLEMINKHNEQYNKGEVTYFMAVNHLADLELEEVIGECLISNLTLPTSQEEYVDFEYENIESANEVDWRQKNVVTPVKNQGRCGSCYAFSVTGTIEGQWAIKTGQLIPLSAQDIVDCTREAGNRGCGGGIMETTMKFITKRGGIDTEESYQYEAVERQCRYNPANSKVAIKGVKRVRPSENALQQAVTTIGPISIGVAVTDNFRFYRGGVFSDPSCNPTKIGHAILAIGYGESPQPYWLVKNSWGTTWGEAGYMKLARNKNNMCGVASMATYPLV